MAFFLFIYVNKTIASVLIVGFPYLDLQNIYKQILNPIGIPIVGEFVHRYVIGWMLHTFTPPCYLWFVLAQVYSKNKFIRNCEANHGV